MSENVKEYVERCMREEFALHEISVEDALRISLKPYENTAVWGIGAEIALKILAAEVIRLREVKG